MKDHILIAGMPASGKSTYIGALRHVLLAREIPCALEQVTLSNEESHLNNLESEWLNCNEVERTKPSTETWVKFNVKDVKTDEIVTLTVPDMRGEAFEQPATTGKCNEEILDALNVSGGLLLFTNADREDDKLLLSDFADIFGDGDCGENVQPKQFEPSKMPEEVKIVEFLQMANRRPRKPIRRKLALVVSAWDVVDSSIRNDPAKWFAQNRIMLHQFLQNNSDLWETRIYGISAQGGRLPEDKHKLEKMEVPSERITVVGPEVSEHDLTSPLRWLMVQDE